MAIFGKSEKKTVTEVKSNSSSTTIITSCMEIEGNIKGCGTIHIDGTVHGDLHIDESVVIGKSGVVYGNVHAKKVMVSGKLKGSLSCNILEVTQTGAISNKIEAKEIISDGTLEAVVMAENMIHITQNGKVETEKMQSKHIVVNGHIVGSLIATELLEINKDGQVKGEMTVKKIKVAEGGLMLGTMLTYEVSNTVKTVNTRSEEKSNNENESEKETLEN